MGKAPTPRGLFRYYGGKAMLSRWINSLLPPHTAYVEPYAGGAWVLFGKERSEVEILNDLDGHVVAALMAARDFPHDLAAALAMTPYSREEFARVCRLSEENVGLIEQARQFFVVVNQSRNGIPRPFPGNWRRQRAATAREHPQRAWSKLPDWVVEASERLANVAVECRDGWEVMQFNDSANTLFYIDPPYHPELAVTKWYRHPFTADDHVALVSNLAALSGMVVLSGYDHACYAETLASWHQVKRPMRCHAAIGGVDRTECLWFNPSAWEARQRAQEAH